MRIAIGLLVVLAIASVIGTVLTQQAPYANYVNQFGPFWAEIFDALGLVHVYGSAWFTAILLFLVISLSVCLANHGPKIVADLRSWKDRVQEQSLRAFGHQASFHAAGSRTEMAARLSRLVEAQGYRQRQQEKAGATLMTAKRGALNRLGYLWTHLGIIVICTGGLLDGSLPVTLQMWWFNKSPLHGNMTIAEVPPEHRLPAANPSFRAQAWVPEGRYVSTAVLNRGNGVLIQDLPFSIQLNQFIVEYYSTGMPKRFASDIVVIDHANGARIPARVEVNKPFIYRGIAIYQSSFEDGGSTVHLSAYPMRGARTSAFKLSGTVGESAQIAGAQKGETVEWTGLRAINVENIADGAGQTDARGLAKKRGLREVFDERLGSGAKASKPVQLRNIGPSLQYILRDQSGGAREFNTYMLPVDIDGERVFLAGLRENPNEPFRYLRIPADAEGTLRQWMQLRAALANPALHAAAARKFAAALQSPEPRLRARAEQSAARVLALFAGQSEIQPRRARAIGGFAAVADFIESSVPKPEQNRAAQLLLRVLEGAVWELWQVSRARAGEPALKETEANRRFVQSAMNALSDHFFYRAPVLLQLNTFNEVKASVFQLTRAPGKKWVYLGCALLVLGVFSMFFIRERRLWFWLKDDDAQVNVLMAMSTARRTVDFENEFNHLRDNVRAALNASEADR
ncbi:Putative cytochrome C biogenesis protein [Candidatus Glomeribacter gigasporarum BEG34]|uniref:Putative cytochrome C biogenesis protein n=1 Tax=Candidatus Glomeribacter gigasporarum BEG34 TaxID=1070319 RepID=G2J7L4_9BURK|nr:cytochrome c biogenesis protein ResB [Candidatus Glomeribacter gigasporarum]CCD28759.1 Putative cytochrome C biogenesis protein [Candidatus Glomeribacter gigasporarum BEG34]